MTQTAANLTNDTRAAIASELNEALAETVVTTMMAQNFHWNVTGMSFGALHTLFQTIYEDHFVAQDEIAERVRALGAAAEGTLAAMLERSAVKEVPGKPSDKQMLLALAEAQEAITATLARTAATAAEHGDPLTEDLCIARGQAHEKFTWMLRAHLS